ncbi:MAG: cytochrome c oxidase accessory protein CcoG [Candidatus Kapabacteria bacterium]|jgi:cytochrome c oxidase accessory protein FixG|nr:cytochrome c oxidase accessory protein CcoG [Candidatus Kapabacteria bacterium]
METDYHHLDVIGQQIAEEQQAFRNELASINKDGSRKWVYTQETHGRYTTARNFVAYTLLLFLFTAPFVRIHDNPLILLNVLERKFIIFGIVFWPQDFYLVVLGLLTFILGIAVFTSILGRIWCGWTCPQTIFLEFVFRKVEKLIEGNVHKQMALDKAPMSGEKFARKALKHTVFLVMSWVICNLFLSYIIGTDELFKLITEPPSQHISGLTAMVVVSGLFYGVFSRFREQACLVACPYGRFMSALVDPDTVAVTYDFKRGEPRRKPSKADKIAGGVNEARGDCIDCGQCVTVCPTAIDIRNGIQLECVNCTACIDACDSVMTKIKKPTGLIRYTSANAVTKGTINHFSTRVKGYITVLLVMITVVTTLFLRRPEVEAIIMRQPGTLSQKVGDDKIANFYTLQLINKTFDPKTAEIRVLEPQGATLTPLGDYTRLAEQNVQHGRFFVAIPKGALNGTYNTIKLGVFANGKQIKEVKTTFIAPAK